MQTAAPSKAVVLLLLLHCFWRFCVLSLFRYTILSVLSSFAINSPMKSLRAGCFGCVLTFVPMYVFMVPWVGLWSEIVAYPGHIKSLAFFSNIQWVKLIRNFDVAYIDPNNHRFR